MSLLNVGARALMANQVALQTTGHNIANVSTAGYSRQSAQMVTVQGQFTGNVDLSAMTLTIIESDAVNFIVLMKSLNQAGSGILSSAEHDDSTFHKSSRQLR